MDKYQPKDFEEKWYKRWEQDNNFAPSGVGTPYSIAIPPPNVTGTLHMGHAFQHSLVDSLIRYRRMKGHNTLWQMGTDHAGIATQLIVTEQLAAENITPSDLGREKFVQKIWDWKRTSGNTISKQLRRIGASLHWETERFTLDEGLSRAVHEVFVRLYEEGLIYRGKRLVNWDPVLKTSISDLEVVAQEEEGHLWHLRYPLAEDPNKYIVVATTRPETMLGDTAVAVHPEDERYKSLVGQSIMLPLSQRTIPIISDEYVDQDFGSGCVKITPAHDFNDYDMGTRHDLEVINVFNEDASVNEQAPKKYHGMDRYEARNVILRDLEELGMIEKIEAHTLSVPRGERSGVIIEPYLSDQWFVKTRPLAEPATEKVKSGEIEFIPKNYENTFFAWMKDIQDWCISRQQWWGHRIPAWYDEENNIYVGESEEYIRDKYNISDSITLAQDNDVLDTWFSSSLWPFSTLGWPDKTKELENFYPTSVLVTGFDIIFFWVARMIMMGMKFMDRVPFKTIYIHGLVRDSDGKKMSKSVGNVIDPIDVIDGIKQSDLIEKRISNLVQPQLKDKIAKRTKEEFPNGIDSFGADALRFCFCALASTGRDINFDLKRIEGYRNFCNKLWNASRYVLMTSENVEYLNKVDFDKLTTYEKYLLIKLDNIVTEYKRNCTTYRFDLMASSLYSFIWNEYCDWYLEISKVQIHDGNEYSKSFLLYTLQIILKLCHPIIPYITEEIWSEMYKLDYTKESLLMNSKFPSQQKIFNDIEIEREIEIVKDIINSIRKTRSDLNIHPKTLLDIYCISDRENLLTNIKNNKNIIHSLSKVKSINYEIDSGAIKDCITVSVRDLIIYIPIKDTVNVDDETNRLRKKINEIESALIKVNNKLDNKNFIEKAPSNVIKENTDKQKVYQQELIDLKNLLDKLSN